MLTGMLNSKMLMNIVRTLRQLIYTTKPQALKPQTVNPSNLHPETRNP